MADRENRPVLTGLVALVAVALTIGLILGGVAWAASKMAGLGGASQVDDAARRSLYLPKPAKTSGPSGPLITLAPGEESSSSSSESAEPKHTKKPPKPSKKISLSAGQTEVAPMQQIDLTGVYPGGEGAILQVQRFTDGRWQDFPVTVSVSNETFSTYVQTSQAGENRFRVVDTDSDRTSNVVRVQIG